MPPERVDGFPRTSYVAVTGPKSAWPDGAGISLDEIGDGPDVTVMAIEHSGDIAWAAPEDVSFEDAVDKLASRAPAEMAAHRREKFLSIEYDFGHVLFADGSTMQAGSGIDRATWSQLLAINDGASGPEWSQAAFRTQSIGDVRLVRIDKCVELGVFVVLCLFPLPWVWLNPTSGRPPTETNGHLNSMRPATT